MTAPRSELDDGGPAFAATAANGAGDVFHQDGMSLRDWFAGQALGSLVRVAQDARARDLGLIGKAAYEFADAMLKARKESRHD